MCTPSPVLAIPDQALELRLFPAEDEDLPRNSESAYVVAQGRQITLNAQIEAPGIENITQPVQIELTVPEGISPRGMTIRDEDQTLLNLLFALLNAINPDLEGLANDILGIDVTDQQTTFIYTLENGVTVGQSFPITLEVVGERVGEFEVSGAASIVSSDESASLEGAIEATQTPLVSSTLAEEQRLMISFVQSACEITIGGSLADRIPIYTNPFELDTNERDIDTSIQVVSRDPAPQEDPIVDDDYSFINNDPSLRFFNATLTAQYSIRAGSNQFNWYYIIFEPNQFGVRSSNVVGRGWIRPGDWAKVAGSNGNNPSSCIEGLPEVDRNGATPSVAIPFESGNLSLVYAPIPGNPVLEFGGVLQGDNIYMLRATQYALNPTVLNVDQANSEIWIRVTVYRGDLPTSGWVLVNSSLPTNTTPNASITLDSIVVDQVRTRLLDQTSTYGDVLDDFVTGNEMRDINDPGRWTQEPTFNFLPISLEDFCASTTTQIRGLGVKYSNPATPDDPNSVGTYGLFGHEGADFFGLPPTVRTDLTSGTNVYSIASTIGVVVGIGREWEGTDSRLLVNTVSYWGATDVSEGTGYSVIVRYGHLYVLYGHLITIEQNIFVGAPIQPQQQIGVLGTEADTHLHLEIRSYGDQLNSSQQLAPVGAWLGFVRNYDGIQFPNRPPNAYDAITLLPNPILAWSNNSSSTLVEIAGMDLSLYADGDPNTNSERYVISPLSGVCSVVFNYYADSANYPLQRTTYTFPMPTVMVTIPAMYFEVSQPNVTLPVSPNQLPLYPERN